MPHFCIFETLMKSLRLHIARCVTLVVALQILNFGLFAQEFDPIGSSAPSEEFNIINTLVEYVAETVLQHKNAMPENNSDSKKDMQAHKHSSFKLFSIQKNNLRLLSSTRLRRYINQLYQ